MATTSIECSVPGCSFRTPRLPERFYPKMVDQLKVTFLTLLSILALLKIIVGIVGIVDIVGMVLLTYFVLLTLLTFLGNNRYC